MNEETMSPDEAMRHLSECPYCQTASYSAAYCTLCRRSPVRGYILGRRCKSILRVKVTDTCTVSWGACMDCLEKLGIIDGKVYKSYAINATIKKEMMKSLQDFKKRISHGTH